MDRNRDSQLDIKIDSLPKDSWLSTEQINKNACPEFIDSLLITGNQNTQIDNRQIDRQIDRQIIDRQIDRELDRYIIVGWIHDRQIDITWIDM